jgi:hypothetical protein
MERLILPEKAFSLNEKFEIGPRFTLIIAPLQEQVSVPAAPAAIVNPNEEPYCSIGTNK